MAAMDFPASPTDGQVYGNYVWSASTGAWLSKGVTQTTAVTSDVAPSNPKAGDMWYNSTDGVMYLYYNDGNTSQWVQFKNDASFTSTLGPRVDTLFLESPNYILNAELNINQRNITSITNSGTGTTWGVDKWPVYCTNGSTVYSVQAISPGTGPVDYEFKNSVRLATSGQTGTATDRVTLYQTIEDVRTLAGKTATFSFWAKSSTGTPNISVEAYQYFGTGGSPSADVPGSVGNNTVKKISLTGGTSWTRYSVTLSIPSIVGKTLGTNNDHYLAIFIWTSAGSNNATRSDSLGTQNNTIDFVGLQLEAGSLATSFHRSAPTIQGELAACQRHYYRINTVGVNNSFYGGFGNAYSTTGALIPITYPVTMRVPTTSIDYSSLALYDGANGRVNVTGVTTSDYSASGCMANHATASGLTQYRGYSSINASTGSGYLGFSAEL